MSINIQTGPKNQTLLGKTNGIATRDLDMSSLKLPPAGAPSENSPYTLTVAPQSGQSTNRSDPVNDAFDALKAAKRSAEGAINNNRPDAIKGAEDATDHAAKAAAGAIDIFDRVMGGGSMAPAAGKFSDYGKQITKMAQSLAHLGIDTADIILSNKLSENVSNFKKFASLLMNMNSDIITLDKEIRNFSNLNPKSLQAVSNLNDAIKQMSTVYDQLKQDGIDPALVDPKFGKFMDRIKEAGSNFTDFTDHYSKYTVHAKGLPQMGTFADAVDYAKSNFDLSGQHRMHRIERNLEAKDALASWDKFRDNFQKISSLDDFN